jgi:hypothetical protein
VEVELRLGFAFLIARAGVCDVGRAYRRIGQRAGEWK